MSVDTIERPDTRTELREIARIYANGRNDDVPGLVAAFKNEVVEHDGRVYEPGEDVTVDGDKKRRTLVLSARLIVRGPDAKPIDAVSEIEQGPYVIVNVSKPTGRAVNIVDCIIQCKPSKEWPGPFPHAIWFDDVDVTAEDNSGDRA